MEKVKDFFEDMTIWRTVFFCVGTVFFISLLSPAIRESLFLISFIISICAGFLASLFNFRRAISALVWFLIGPVGGLILMMAFSVLKADTLNFANIYLIFRELVKMTLMLSFIAAIVWIVGLPLSYFLGKKLLSKL